MKSNNGGKETLKKSSFSFLFIAIALAFAVGCAVMAERSVATADRAALGYKGLGGNHFARADV